jgi:hypothetical protein
MSIAIERLEAFEDRAGVTLEALFCSVAGPDDDGDFLVEVNGEMHSTSGIGLQSNIELILAVYDVHGRLIAKLIDFITEDDFFGFHTFSISSYVKNGTPFRFRLYPQVS